MNKEDKLYKLSQGTYTAVWAHDEIRRQSKRITELEKGLEIAFPILRSATKQQWGGAYNAFQICSSLLKEQGE